MGTDKPQAGTSLPSVVTPPSVAEGQTAIEPSAHTELFTRALQHSQQPFVWGERNGRLLGCNAAFERLAGYTSAELQQRDWLEDLTPPEWHEQERVVRDALTTAREPHRYWREILRKDGSRLPIELLLDVSVNADGSGGNFLALVLSASIAPDRRAPQPAAALDGSEGLVRRVIDHTLAFIGVLTPDGTLIEANETALSAGGLTRADVVGRKFWDCYWWSYDPGIQAQLRDAVSRAARGESIRYDVVVRIAGGRRLPIDFMLSALRDEAGRVVSLIPSAIDISDRKHVEDALQQTQARLSLALEAARAGTFELDVDLGVPAVISGAVRELFGFGQDERPRFDDMLLCVHPDDRDRVRAAVREAMTGGDGHYIEYRVVQPDGQLSWLASRARAVRGGDGTRRLVGALLDITERVRAEESVRRSEERFRKVFEHAPTGIAITDTQGRVLQLNEAHARLLGFPEEELRGVMFLDLLHPDDRDENRAQFQRLLAGELTYFHIENRYVHKNGTPVWVNTFVSALPDAQGRPAHVVALVTDVTERRRADELLAAARRRLDAALFAGEVGTFEWNIVDDRMWGDPNFARIFQVELEADGAAPIGAYLRLIHPDDVARVQEKVSRAVETGADYEAEYRVVVDQQVRWVIARGKALRDAAGTPVTFAGVLLDVTEQKRAEEDLRRSTALLSAISDAAEDAIFAKDREGRLTFANPATLALVGKPAAQVLGRTDADILEDKEAAGRVMANDRRIMDGGVAEELEEVVPLADGTPRVWLSRKMPYRNVDGKVIGLLGVSRDITERRGAHEEMERQQRLLSAVLDALPIGLVIADKNGRVLRDNQANRDLWGMTPDTERWEQYGEWAGYWPETGERIKAHEWAMSRALLKGETVRGELVQNERFGTGERRYYLNNAAPVMGPDGTVIGGVVAAMDVTEQRAAEQRAIDAERRATLDYQQLLSRISPLAQTLGTSRHVDTIYSAVLDFVRQEIPCESLRVELYDDSRRQKVVKFDWRGEATQAGPMHTLVTPMSVTGRVIGTIAVRNTSTPYGPEHTVALEMAANLAAVAIENVRLIDGETRARELAEEANRSKDEFLAVLSHELRTPLHAMKGWIELLRQGSLDDQRKDHAVDVIARNVEAQNALIGDILDVSRIISGKLTLEPRRLSLVSAISHAVEEARPAAEAAGLSLTLSLGPDADDAYGDPFRVRQIVANLLSNATKFTPSGGRIEVSLTASAEGNEAVLAIHDTGVGIDAALMPHIFDRFRQADSSSRRRHGGLGLGLSIVKHLVELHGGTITAESAGTGLGSTFTVRLPLQPRTPVTQTRRSVQRDGAAPGTTPRPLTGVRLLVVEDNEDSVEFLTFSLEHSGATVTAARSSAEALALVQTAAFDLIISDLGLPDMDGFELMRTIRGQLAMAAAELPAIALSGYAAAEDRDRSAASGFQMHIAKPLDLAALPAQVLSLLGRTQRRQ